MTELNLDETIEQNYATEQISKEVMALLDPKTGRKFRSKKAKRRAITEIVERHVNEAIRAVGEYRNNRMELMLQVKLN